MEISLQDLLSLVRSQAGGTTSLQVGQAYLLRTVTHYYTGRIKAITDTDIVLGEAAWIADTGRFSDCLKESCVQEAEPFQEDAIVFRGGLIDATKWSGTLPAEQK